MKFGRSACLAGMIALGAWSVAACSKDTTGGNTDGGTGGEDGGGSGGKGTGGSSTGGKGGSGGSSTGGKGGSGTGGSSVVDGGNDGGLPTLSITSPKDNGDVTSTTVPIVMDIKNFALMPPGSGATKCPAGSCGHVHLNVDLNACNASGAPYNAAGASTTIPIDLSLCPAATIPGAHIVDATLHNNDHSAVKVGGNTVGMSITINYVAGDAGADSGTK